MAKVFRASTLLCRCNFAFLRVFACRQNCLKLYHDYACLRITTKEFFLRFGLFLVKVIYLPVRSCRTVWLIAGEKYQENAGSERKRKAMLESNYEIAKRSSAQLFCQTDHSQLIQRFGVQEKNGFLFVQLFGQPFRVNVETGEVERSAEGCAAHQAENPSKSPVERAVTPPKPRTWVSAQYDEAMTLYDLFSYAKPTCRASNIMVNMKSLHLQIAASAPSSTALYAKQETLFAQAEAQRPGIISCAMALFGGTAIKAAADYAFQFNVLDDLNMQVHFWLADEDFPASLQLYWDKNVLDYLHYETVWYANSFVLNELVALLKQLECI